MIRIQETVTVKIPGLKRTYTFFHTSDCHVAYALETESERAKEMAEEQTAFWNQKGFIPRETLDEALRLAEAEKADGIFLCGDLQDYCTEGTLWYVRDRLTKSSVETFFVLGNHEDSGQDLETDKKTYGDLMFGSPDIWMREFEEFMIVGVDNSNHLITKHQLQKMEEFMALKKPILLLMHIPPYTENAAEAINEYWKDMYWVEGQKPDQYFTFGHPHNTEDTKTFHSMLFNPENPIAAVFAGHIHTSYTGEFLPGKPMCVSPPSFNGVIRKVIVTGEDA